MSNKKKKGRNLKLPNGLVIDFSDLFKDIKLELDIDRLNEALHGEKRYTISYKDEVIGIYRLNDLRE